MMVERVFLLFLLLGLSEALKDNNCKGIIAFSSAGVNTVHPTGLIHFKTNDFDSGHGWDQNTGTFTVKCPGIYYISFSGIGTTTDTRIILKKRGTMSNSSWVPLRSTPPGGGSNSIIISLSLGEQITVVVSNSAGTGVGSSRTDVDQLAPVTSFSAHRLDD